MAPHKIVREMQEMYKDKKSNYTHHMGNPGCPLGVAIGHAALARPKTGTSEPLGRGPIPGGLGRIAVTVPMS